MNGKFITDKQTTNDLELFHKTKGEKSIFSYYNFTKSLGGKKYLEDIFSEPMTDIREIENRMKLIRYYRDQKPDFEIDKECLDFTEYYLAQRDIPRAYSFRRSLRGALTDRIRPTNEYYIQKRGIRFLIATLNELYSYAKTLKSDDSPDFIKSIGTNILSKVENSSLSAVLGLHKRRKLFPHEFGKFDFYFRRKELYKIQELLAIIYEMDAYISLAISCDQHGFELPEFTQDPHCLTIEGLFHPFLEQPVCNDFNFKPENRLCFLTGPNMAGKSTFLKSISIAIYLAHLGFPVPARKMKTSRFNGLLTTINFSDNLNKGYSHFYNEVLRIKFIAGQLSQNGNIFVVFDELFKGTNVKDAYEASLSVIIALSELNSSLFAISTHIIEIAEKLQDKKSIFFKYFDARLDNDIPQYNYKIKDGVTDERLGMYILKKEHVIELIHSCQ